MRGLLLLGVRVLEGVTLVCNNTDLFYQESEYSGHSAFAELVVVGEMCMLESLPVESVGTLTVTGEFGGDITFPYLSLIGNLKLTELSGRAFHFPSAKVYQDVVLREVMASDISLGTDESSGVYISHCDIRSLNFGQLHRIRERLVVQASTFQSFEARELLRLGGLRIHQKLFDVGRAFPKLSAVEGDAILHIDGGEEVDFGVRLVDGMLRVVTRRAGVLRFSNLARVGESITLFSRSRVLELVALPNLAETDYIRMLSSVKMLLMDPMCRWEGFSLFDANNFCEMYTNTFKKMRFTLKGGCQHPICHGNLVLSDNNLKDFRQCVIFRGTLLVGSSLKGSLQGVPLREVKGSVTLKNRSAFAFAHLAIVSESLLITGKSSTEIWDLGPLQYTKRLTIHQSHGIKEIRSNPPLEIMDLVIRNLSLTTFAYHREKLRTLALSGNQNLSTLLFPNISQISNLIFADNPSLKPINSLFPKIVEIRGGLSLSGSDDKVLDISSYHPKSLVIDSCKKLRRLVISPGTEIETLPSGLEVSDTGGNTVSPKQNALSSKLRIHDCNSHIVIYSNEPYPCLAVFGDLIIRVKHPASLFFPTVIYGNLITSHLECDFSLPRLTKIHGKIITHFSNLHLLNLPSLISIGGLEIHNTDLIPGYLSHVKIERLFSLVSSNVTKIPKLVLHRLASLHIEGNPYLQKLEINFMGGMAREVTIKNNPLLKEVCLDGLSILTKNLTLSGTGLSSFQSSLRYSEGSFIIQKNPQLLHISFPDLISMQGELELMENPKLVLASFPSLKNNTNIS